MFICHTESTQDISEALNIFSEWNSEWQLPFFMTDYSEAGINAINAVFPNCKVYVCSFHREQEWVRWTKKSGNVTFGESGDILSLFRSVVKAATIQDFSQALNILQNHDLWQKKC
jgi:hypothetical protein